MSDNEFQRDIDYSEFDFFKVEIGEDGVAVVTMNNPTS